MKGKHRSDFWAACPLLVLFLSLMGAAEVLASSIIGRIAVIHAYSQMFKSDRAEAMRLGGRGSGEKTGEELWSMTPVPMLGDRGPASPVYKRRLSVGNSPACDQPLPEDDSRGRRVCTELIARVLTNLPVESNTTSFGSSEQDPLRALQNAFGIAIKDRMEGESETTRLHHQVTELSVKGQYDEALRLAEQALQMSAKDSRNRLEKLVIALNNLGQLCAAKGDYDQVERLYERALDFNRHKGVDDEMATTLDNLGELYRVKGDYANAETYLQKALSTTVVIG